MTRLALRLMLSGGKESAVRLVATAVAVALGVGLLLTTLAGINAVKTQNARLAWLTTGYSLSASQNDNEAASDPLWWQVKPDTYDGESIARVDVAATGPDSPVPPGITDLPEPGEFLASPALTELIDSTPASELGDRYPGQQVDSIGPAALPSPDSLVIVVGHSPDELSQASGASQISAIETTSPSSCNGDCLPIGVNANMMAVVLAVTAGLLLFPVLIFIGTATRLAAARREQRYAAMRLVGATPRQVAMITAVESTVVAALGVIGAFGVFFLLRAPVASLPFTGTPFFTSDLSLSLTQVLLVVIGVPLAAAVASRVALRRVRISPLGVTRRTAPRPPRAWRLLPLVAGLAELAIVGAVGRPEGTNNQIIAYAPGFVMAMVGLLVAGPWLTMVGARRLSRRTSRPAALIAGQRLADNPKAGFRAMSGLVLALFVITATLGSITTFAAERGQPKADDATSNTLTQRVLEDDDSVAPLPDTILEDLRAVQGVEGVTSLHESRTATSVAVDGNTVEADLVSCAELVRTPALGRCPTGATVVSIPSRGVGPGDETQAEETTWPDADIAPDQLEGLPLTSMAVATDGSSSAIEQARTLLETSYPNLRHPTSEAEHDAEGTKTLAAWKQLANVIVLMSLVIAGCSLAVSVSASLLDRKRPFGLLRLTGVPLGVLRRVVALESAVPLLIVAAVSIATGFLTAHLFLRVQLDYSLRPPEPEYYLLVSAGLAASLLIIGSTFPLLSRITGPDATRSE
jgi:cell division protein FtsX